VSEITNKLGVPVLGQANSFSEVFKFVLQLSESKSFTLIIDEFQNFQKVNPTVFSDMQRDWDLWKRKSHLNLIISGSVFTLMKKIFEDYEEPLFGRADEKLILQPFKTDVLKEILNDFNPDYTPEDLLALFSITGGVAWYVTLLLDRGKIRKTKMLAALTEENSPFINEGKNILKEASVYELKKDESRYDETTFKEKVATMLDQTPELRKMTIHIGTLSKKDM
jgi:hypothetical protein